MARPLRIEAPGLTYHVHSRGNGQMTIFRDDVDAKRFLDNLAAVFPEQRVLCYAYCAMSNHYHVVIRTELANLSETMHRVNGTYAQWWNRRHKHVGHVFQGRFTAHVIESTVYLLQACRYVVNNPVDARIACHASEYRWSSYRATAGLAPSPSFLDVETLRCQLGSDDPTEAYVKLVAEPACETFLKLMKAGRSVIGSDAFARQFSDHAKGKTGLTAADRRVGRPSLAELLSGVPHRLALEGRIAEAHDRYRYTRGEIAECLGAGISWVGKLLKAGRQTGCRHSGMASERSRFQA
jgi:putative transposase